MVKLRSFIIGMTLLAVISDAIIMPFYPQFFRDVFLINDPEHVGFYIAATCLTVMFAFPFWAWVARKVTELKILVFTQFAAGLLCIACYFTENITAFWVISLTMIICKGSYLLMYPFVMRITEKNAHGRMVGVLSVIVHFGSIGGAVIGGLTIKDFDPRVLFLIMAVGDFVQMAVSGWLLTTRRYEDQLTVKEVPADSPTTPSGFVVKLGVITLIFYFSAFLIRPFFSVYWAAISQNTNTLISGLVYAIPGFVALVALALDKKLKKPATTYQGILPPMLLGLAGMLLQGSEIMSVVIIGRLVYGWAVYHAVVRYDVLLFELSTPESYATDYSKIHFFQNLGVLISSFSSGMLVDELGPVVTFFVASAGFVVTMALYYVCFRLQLKTPQLNLKEQL